jgi:hypothetical protein
VAAVYEIEHKVHGVIANVLPGVIGISPSESQLEIGSEPCGSAQKNPPWLVAFFISPLVHRPAFNPQTAATGALSQAQDDIRLILLDGVDELAFVKSHREDDLFEAGSSRKLPQDLLGDVIFKLAIGAKAVDQQTHLQMIKITDVYFESNSTSADRYFEVRSFDQLCVFVVRNHPPLHVRIGSYR